MVSRSYIPGYNREIQFYNPAADQIAMQGFQNLDKMYLENEEKLGQLQALGEFDYGNQATNEAVAGMLDRDTQELSKVAKGNDMMPDYSRLRAGDILRRAGKYQAVAQKAEEMKQAKALRDKLDDAGQYTPKMILDENTGTYKKADDEMFSQSLVDPKTGKINNIDYFSTFAEKPQYEPVLDKIAASLSSGATDDPQILAIPEVKYLLNIKQGKGLTSDDVMKMSETSIAKIANVLRASNKNIDDYAIYTSGSNDAMDASYATNDLVRNYLANAVKRDEDNQFMWDQGAMMEAREDAERSKKQAQLKEFAPKYKSVINPKEFENTQSFYTSILDDLSEDKSGNNVLKMMGVDRGNLENVIKSSGNRAGQLDEAYGFIASGILALSGDSTKEKIGKLSEKYPMLRSVSGNDDNRFIQSVMDYELSNSKTLGKQIDLVSTDADKTILKYASGKNLISDEDWSDYLKDGDIDDDDKLTYNDMVKKGVNIMGTYLDYNNNSFTIETSDGNKYHMPADAMDDATYNMISNVSQLNKVVGDMSGKFGDSYDVTVYLPVGGSVKPIKGKIRNGYDSKRGYIKKILTTELNDDEVVLNNPDNLEIGLLNLYGLGTIFGQTSYSN